MNMDEQTNNIQEQQPSKQGNTKLIIIGILVALIAIAAAVLVYHQLYTKPLLAENEDLKELAELEKQEMENQYREFDLQYEQLQSTLKNDSLIAQIENERRHTQQLLEELERTKATDAAEIKQNLIAQLTSSVRWTQIVQNMIADGAADFTECGPGKALQGMIAKINKDIPAHGIE